MGFEKNINNDCPEGLENTEIIDMNANILCNQLKSDKTVGGHPNRRIGETHVLNENGLCRPKKHTCSSLAISRIFLNNTIR